MKSWDSGDISPYTPPLITIYCNTVTIWKSLRTNSRASKPTGRAHELGKGSEQWKAAKNPISVSLVLLGNWLRFQWHQLIFCCWQGARCGRGRTVLHHPPMNCTAAHTGQSLHTGEVTPGNKPPKIPQNSHFNGV